MFKKTVLLLVPSLFALATLISLFSFWLGDLFSHFRMFWTVLSFIFLIGYTILFIKKVVLQEHIVFISIVFILNLIGSFSFWKNPQTYEYLFFGNPISIEYSENVKQEIENDTTVKKLLLMNVLSSNTNYEEARKLIKNVDADFVVIIELNKNWEKELEKLNYYSFTNPMQNNFGMGVYSKTVFTDSVLLNIFINEEKQKMGNELLKKVTTDDPFRYYEKATLEFESVIKKPAIKVQSKQGINIIAAHPIPPISPFVYSERNHDLNQLALFIQKRSTKKTLFVGDFNCSSFSSDYEKFLYTSNLKDSQENYGFQPTWNSTFPFLMQTQLDHVWHSDDIEILHRQTLPITGSDHKAVFVVFR